MELEEPRPSGIRDEPLVAIGIAGFFLGGVFFELLRGTVPRGFDSISDLPVIRLELAAMTTRIASLVIALLGLWSLQRRLPRRRVGLALLAVGLLVTLGVELARIRLADWRCPEEDAYCGSADRLSELMIQVHGVAVPLAMLGLALLARWWMMLFALPLVLLAVVAGPDPSPFVWWPDTWWRDWPHVAFRDSGWLRVTYGLSCGVGALALVHSALSRDAVPRVVSVGMTVAALRRLSVALAAMGMFSLVVAVGAEETGSTNVGVVASGIACVIALAILGSVASLARHAGSAELSRWASLATALLTWAFVLNALHGFILYGEWIAWEQWVDAPATGDNWMSAPTSHGEWLVALVSMAPLLTLSGLLTLVVGIARRVPDSPAVGYGTAMTVVSVIAMVAQLEQLPRMDPHSEVLPGMLVLYLAPPMILVPLLRRAARQLERDAMSELAAARVV